MVWGPPTVFCLCYPCSILIPAFFEFWFLGISLPIFLLSTFLVSISGFDNSYVILEYEQHGLCVWVLVCVHGYVFNQFKNCCFLIEKLKKFNPFSLYYITYIHAAIGCYKQCFVFILHCCFLFYDWQTCFVCNFQNYQTFLNFFNWMNQEKMHSFNSINIKLHMHWKTS